jgi:hypothetical protein
MTSPKTLFFIQIFELDVSLFPVKKFRDLLKIHNVMVFYHLSLMNCFSSKESYQLLSLNLEKLHRMFHFPKSICTK